MARQPIEKLQGYGQTSSPSAAPIDSYTGAPQVARETPATQLAQALGTMSSAVAKAGARAEAEKQELSEKKIQRRRLVLGIRKRRLLRVCRSRSDKRQANNNK